MASPVREENPFLSSAEPTNLQDAKTCFSPNRTDLIFFRPSGCSNCSQPDRSPVGDFANPRREAVRFGVNASLAFPASAIQSLKPGEPDSAGRHGRELHGLGRPARLTSQLLHRTRRRSRSRRTTPPYPTFLNIFHHRAISLFYRAWERSHFTVGYEREGSDSMTSRLLDFVGLGLPSLQSRQVIRDESILYYSGLFGLSSRSALRSNPFFPTTSTCLSKLSSSSASGVHSSTPINAASISAARRIVAKLGFGAVAGDEIWDRQSRAQIRIGPLDAKRYRDFLPDGTVFQPLQALARFFSGNDVEFEVQLILKQEQVPACELGDESGNAQLGWFTWMKSKPVFRSQSLRHSLTLRGELYMTVNLRSLIGKLNTTTRNAVEGAAGLCLSRTHYDVEVEHFLTKLLAATGADFAFILRHFGVDNSRFAAELNRSLDKLKSGNARTPAISPTVLKMFTEAWTYGSLEFGFHFHPLRIRHRRARFERRTLAPHARCQQRISEDRLGCAAQRLRPDRLRFSGRGAKW